MEEIDFSRELTSEELSKLSPIERRKYLLARKEKNSEDMIADILESASKEKTQPTLQKDTAPSDPKEPKKQPKEKPIQQVKRDAKGRADKGLGLNSDGTFRQSRAGRKKLSAEAKKLQLSILLRKDQVDAIKDVADKMGYTVQEYLTEFIVNHMEEILKKN